MQKPPCAKCTAAFLENKLLKETKTPLGDRGHRAGQREMRKGQSKPSYKNNSFAISFAFIIQRTNEKNVERSLISYQVKEWKKSKGKLLTNKIPHDIICLVSPTTSCGRGG